MPRRPHSPSSLEGPAGQAKAQELARARLGDRLCVSSVTTPEGKVRVSGMNHEEVLQVSRELTADMYLRLPQSIRDRFPIPTTRARKVFLVHGRDEAAQEAVGRFLEKIGLEAIILHEQPDRGLTIIEKVEAYADQVSFAVVLLTPDDLGGLSSTSVRARRARQNVIFELGYFAGKLGRGRVCLMRKGNLEIPSDLYGVIYTDMDVVGGWKLKLMKELKAAGLNFDASKVLP
jgi:predicted nucleotide-binding protein